MGYNIGYYYKYRCMPHQTTYVDKRIINLSSNTGTKNNGLMNSDITYDFPNLLTNEKDLAFAEIGVVSAEIPVSFYIVNENNNVLNFQWTSLGGVTGTYVINIPYGNYTANSLMPELVTLIYAAVTFGGVGVEWLFITISQATGKLTWTCDMAIIGGFSLLEPNSTSWYILGGGDASSYVFTIGTPAHTLDMPLTLLGSNNVAITSDGLMTYNYDSAAEGFSNVLASVEIDAPAFGIILYKNSSITYNILRVLNISTFAIEMKDDFRRLLDFNGINWTLTLSLNLHKFSPNLTLTTFGSLLNQPRLGGVAATPAKKKKPEDKELKLLTS